MALRTPDDYVNHPKHLMTYIVGEPGPGGEVKVENNKDEIIKHLESTGKFSQIIEQNWAEFSKNR